tara:strand:- start:2358 stop:2645 length:288 start_codon:yes stop_codon:yes gene_type:complete
LAGSRVRAAIPHHVEEKAIGFNRVPSGLYQLVNQVVIKDMVTLKKVSTCKKESEALFEITEGADFDYELSYEDQDGTMKSLRFKQALIDENLHKN